MRKIYYLLLLTAVLCVSCEFKFSPNGAEEGDARMEVQRFDRLESRYLTTGDFSAMQEMDIQYPMQARTLIEKVLQLGAMSDQDISTRFLRYYQDSTLQQLIIDVGSEYANMDDINSQLRLCFAKLKNWLPDMPIPTVYAQIGSFDQSIIVGDKMIGICLDKYMGRNYKLYEKYYSYTQRQSMTRSYIVPDCMLFYLLSLYPLDRYDSRTQLERDLHMGKVMWVVNRAVGQHLFNTPYVQTVDQFMKKHPKVTIAYLMMKDDIRGLSA